MTVERNGILFSDNGELYVSGLDSASNVPTSANPTKGDTHTPIFGKYTDSTGAVYVRFV